MLNGTATYSFELRKWYCLFLRIQVTQTHVKQQKPNKTSFSCNICSRVFPTQCGLQQRKKQHKRDVYERTKRHARHKETYKTKRKPKLVRWFLPNGDVTQVNEDEFPAHQLGKRKDKCKRCCAVRWEAQRKGLRLRVRTNMVSRVSCKLNEVDVYYICLVTDFTKTTSWSNSFGVQWTFTKVAKTWLDARSLFGLVC